jgi:hypothetical protein
MRLITLDIKDLYVNLPTQGVLHAAKSWLQRGLSNGDMNKQILILLNTVTEQNYFQYNNQFYKPHKGTAMGSPISGTIAEIYLQHIENDYIKHWLDRNEICFYKRYVDDIFIIYN